MSNQVEKTQVITVNAETGEEKETELATTPVVMTSKFNDAVNSQTSKLKEGKYTKGISINPRYMEFDSVGQTAQGVLIGFKNLHKKEPSGEEKTIPCVVWADENKSIWCNGGIAFVSAFSEMALGQAFEVELVDKKKANSGFVKIYDVKPLFFND